MIFGQDSEGFVLFDFEMTSIRKKHFGRVVIMYSLL